MKNGSEETNNDGLNVIDTEKTDEMLTNSEKEYFLPSINYHLTKACNYKCKFCFARFNSVHSCLEFEEAKKLITLFVTAEVQKVTFVGGEPLLYPHLGELIRYTKELGVTTMVVTNGLLLTEEFLRQYGPYIDWIGFSIESGYEQIEEALGRHPKKVSHTYSGHVQMIRELVPLVKSYGIQVKINTVVTALNWAEDMNWLITELAPARWKVFQVLKIDGENDQEIDPLLITTKQFNTFVDNHKINNPIIERNEAMLGSYIMVDPQGCFVDNATGTLEHSAPILEVGVKQAFNQIRFDYTKFYQRGGLYKWDAQESLSIISNSMR